MPDTAGGKDVYDRLPILVSYGDENKLLGVPKLTSSTGRLMSEVVDYVLKEYHLDSRIVEWDSILLLQIPANIEEHVNYWS